MFDLSAALLNIGFKSIFSETLREGVFDELLLQEEQRAVELLVVIPIVVGLRVAILDGILAVRLLNARRSV